VSLRGLRSYSPGQGRWTSRDPIGERGENPLFVFVSNDPVDSWDLLGREKVSKKKGKIEKDFATWRLVTVYGTRWTVQDRITPQMNLVDANQYGRLMQIIVQAVPRGVPFPEPRTQLGMPLRGRNEMDLPEFYAGGWNDGPNRILDLDRESRVHLRWTPQAVISVRDVRGLGGDPLLDPLWDEPIDWTSFASYGWRSVWTFAAGHFSQPGSRPYAVVGLPVEVPPRCPTILVQTRIHVIAAEEFDVPHDLDISRVRISVTQALSAPASGK